MRGTDGKVRYSGWLGSHLECKTYMQCRVLQGTPSSCLSNSLAQGYNQIKKQKHRWEGCWDGRFQPASSGLPRLFVCLKTCTLHGGKAHAKLERVNTDRTIIILLLSATQILTKQQIFGSLKV